MAEHIDREAALAEIRDAAKEYPYDGSEVEAIQGWSDACMHIRGKLEAMIAPEVMPAVHAHWIVRHIVGGDPYECSHCGDTVSVFGYRLCPSCGAVMDEERVNNG